MVLFFSYFQKKSVFGEGYNPIREYGAMLLFVFLMKCIENTWNTWNSSGVMVQENEAHVTPENNGGLGN